MTDIGDDQELSRQLGRLPRQAEPECDLWPGVVAGLRGDPSRGDGRLNDPGWESRARAASRPGSWTRREVRARPGLWSPFVQVAAAAVLFATGLVSGLAIGTTRADGPSGVESVGTAMELAAEVQRTGTEYVAALAAFTAIVDSLSVDARLQGRDAALAALYGAAQEVALLEFASRGELPAGSEDLPEQPTVRF